MGFVVGFGGWVWVVSVGCGLPTWCGWGSVGKNNKNELFYNILIGSTVK
jgi:hypothetical protein